MGEFHTGSKHQLSGTDPESNFDPYMLHPGYQPKGEGDCDQAYSERVGLISLGRLPT